MIAKIYLYSVSSSKSSPSPSLWFSNFVKKNVFFLIVHFFTLYQNQEGLFL